MLSAPCIGDGRLFLNSLPVDPDLNRMEAEVVENRAKFLEGS